MGKLQTFELLIFVKFQTSKEKMKIQGLGSAKCFPVLIGASGQEEQEGCTRQADLRLLVLSTHVQCQPDTPIITTTVCAQICWNATHFQWKNTRTMVYYLLFFSVESQKSPPPSLSSIKVWLILLEYNWLWFVPMHYSICLQTVTESLTKYIVFLISRAPLEQLWLNAYYA